MGQTAVASEGRVLRDRRVSGACGGGRDGFLVLNGGQGALRWLSSPGSEGGGGGGLGRGRGGVAVVNVDVQLVRAPHVSVSCEGGGEHWWCRSVDLPADEWFRSCINATEEGRKQTEIEEEYAPESFVSVRFTRHTSSCQVSSCQVAIRRFQRAVDQR